MTIHAKGDRVVQANSGPGTVTDADDQHTIIDVDAHGTRVFSTRLVVLEPTSEPAPARSRKRAATKKKTPTA